MLPELHELPITVTSRDYTELSHLPRENLVYLTPDSPNELLSFHHEDIYIIGGQKNINFRPNAVKPGCPYGVMFVSSSLACMTPPTPS